MTVRVRNGYWEYYSTYTDVVRIDENDRTFTLVKKGGFSKEFTKDVYSYNVED